FDSTLVFDNEGRERRKPREISELAEALHADHLERPEASCMDAGDAAASAEQDRQPLQVGDVRQEAEVRLPANRVERERLESGKALDRGEATRMAAYAQELEAPKRREKGHVDRLGSGVAER